MITYYMVCPLLHTTLWLGFMWWCRCLGQEWGDALAGQTSDYLEARVTPSPSPSLVHVLIHKSCEPGSSLEEVQRVLR